MESKYESRREPYEAAMSPMESLISLMELNNLHSMETRSQIGDYFITVNIDRTEEENEENI